MSENLHSDRPNPDSALHAHFYSKLVKNDFKSDLAKEEISDPVDYIKITIPGDTLNTPDRPVRDEDKKRFAAQWHAYQARQGMVSDFQGTPLKKWTRLSDDQVRELEAMKFMNIEAVAQASDAHILGIGMIAGQSAFAFRDEARSFLTKLEADSKLSEADMKVKAMKEESDKIQADLMAKMAAMQEQMTAMAQMVNAQQAEAEAPRRGRPRQEKEAA